MFHDITKAVPKTGSWNPRVKSMMNDDQVDEVRLVIKAIIGNLHHSLYTPSKATIVDPIQL